MTVQKNREMVGIVGGGVTGLFCALALQHLNIPFKLFESTDRLGGRIRTVRLKKDGTVWKDFARCVEQGEDVGKHLDHYADFGPMRLELDLQKLMEALLSMLEITRAPQNELGHWKPHLIEFSPYSSSVSTLDPDFGGPETEKCISPLGLLRLGIIRVLLAIQIDSAFPVSEKLQRFRETKNIDSFDEEGQKELLVDWLAKLNDGDYADLQRNGKWLETPNIHKNGEAAPTNLCQMGFWNLLSDVISHSSIMKIQTLGTFYHLLPDNPNAAEWLIWWMKGMAYGHRLSGICGGAESIIDRMRVRITNPDLRIKTKHTVRRMIRDGRGWVLGFGQKGADAHCSRVILAIPAAPLNGLVRGNIEYFKKIEPRILELTDSAFGFPMVKVFAFVDKRWWKEPMSGNQYATLIPTRELYYWDGMTEGSPTGMIMAYTDRPATAFWSNYAPAGDETDVVDYAGVGLNSRLKGKILSYIQMASGDKVIANNIPWYGIRDWGREPYGAANHAWRPERRFWVVMRRLADVGKGSGIHICGEAYSDYHGFIEGSLRSAVYAIHRLLIAMGERDDLQWVNAVLGNKLGSEDFAALDTWVRSLDAIDTSEEFVLRESPDMGKAAAEPDAHSKART